MKKVDRKKLVHLIAQAIFDKKGMNILALDVRDISTFTDYFILGEGNVDRHVIAIAKEIMDLMEKQGEKPFNVEGLQHGDWVVLDYVDIVIHLFMPGLRERYGLDKLWSKGKIVPLEIAVHSESTQS